MDHALPWFLMLFPMATAALGPSSVGPKSFWGIGSSGVGVCVLSPLQLCWYDVCTLGDFCGQLLLALLQLRPLDAPVGPKLFCEAGSNGRAFPFSVFICLLFT